jgi:hypothetical protein
MDPMEKRITDLKSKMRRCVSFGDMLQSKGVLDPMWAGTKSERRMEDFGRLLQECRERAVTETTEEVLITEQMLNNLEDGRFWRLMQAARKRVGGHVCADRKTQIC